MTLNAFIDMVTAGIANGVVNGNLQMSVEREGELFSITGYITVTEDSLQSDIVEPGSIILHTP